jgi:translocation protein SEC63
LQSLSRIPETLFAAMEFITLPTPSEHSVPIEELRKGVLRSTPDLKDKATFWNRKASCLKVGRRAAQSCILGNTH